MVITYTAPDRVAAPAPPDPTTTPGHRSPWPSGLRRPRPSWCLAVVAAYAIGAWLLYLPLGLVDSAHIAGAVNADQADQVWFLALADWCVVHAHLSPFTTLIDYPSGINLLDNAGMPLLGVAMAPVTAVLGPVASFALLMRLSFVISATACFLVLRRVLRRDLAAAVGGAFYGFSPYMTHQAETHIFLVFVPLPPIFFLLVYRQLLAPWGRRAVQRGMLLGGLAVLQYLICSEILVSTLVVLAVTLVVLGGSEVSRHRSIRSQARTVRRLATGLAVISVPLLAYPAWYALAGPQHVDGPTQSVTSPGIDVLATVLPTDRALLAGIWPGWRVAPLPLLGDTAFLGVPLLVVLAWVVITGRRSSLVRVAAVGGVVAWVLALGPRLVVDGTVTAIPLPFALFTRVPVLQDIIPNRFTLYVDLATAVLLAVGAERLLDRLVGAAGTRRWSGCGAGMTRRRVGALAGGVAGLAALAGSVALALPAATYPAVDIAAASAFGDQAITGYIPAGSMVLTYPYPSFPNDQAMLWQAVAGMQFSVLGGYGIRPDSGGGQTHAPVLPQPAAVPDLLLQAWSSSLPPAPSLVASAAAELPAFVSQNHVSTVVVDLAGADPNAVVALLRGTFGLPRQIDGFDLWTLGPGGGARSG
jgi:hypothetical protein